jgi:hypothetical protein
LKQEKRDVDDIAYRETQNSKKQISEIQNLKQQIYKLEGVVQVG